METPQGASRAARAGGALPAVPFRVSRAWRGSGGQGWRKKRAPASATPHLPSPSCSRGMNGGMMQWAGLLPNALWGWSGGGGSGGMLAAEAPESFPTSPIRWSHSHRRKCEAVPEKPPAAPPSRRAEAPWDRVAGRNSPSPASPSGPFHPGSQPRGRLDQYQCREREFILSLAFTEIPGGCQKGPRGSAP